MSEPEDETEAAAPAETCQETAGFLFDHPCDRSGYGACDACGKVTCRRHRHELDAETLCTGCAREAVAEALRHGHRYGRLADEPCFYRLHHYGT